MPRVLQKWWHTTAALGSYRKLQSSVAKLSSISSSIDTLTKVEIPKLKSSLVAVENSQHTFKEEVDESIKYITIDIGDLKLSVSKLESASASHSNYGKGQDSLLSSGNSENFLPLSDELENRKLKENNMIIHNVPEQIKSDTNKLVRDYDLNEVNGALQKIQNISTKLDCKKVRRLGSFSASKVRPLLVQFDARDDALNVITHWRLLPRDLYFSFDLTKWQRDQYNLLKNEAKNFNELAANKV